MTAKELNALSLEDRERLFEELNGVSSTIDEEPLFVTKCLMSMDDEINRSRMDRSAYDLAISMRPELLLDQSFRLTAKTRQDMRFKYLRRLFNQDHPSRNIVE